MNDNLQPLPNEHLEARITAWVLGQASPFEIAELEALCAADPELQLFLNRTTALHSLLLETPPSSSDQFWKISSENRAKLDPIIGSNNSTSSHKDSSIRRAAYRTAFGIAAVLTVTVFIKRFVIFSPQTVKETSTIVSYNSYVDAEESISPKAQQAESFAELKSESKSMRIASSIERKPSAPSFSTPAPTRQRDNTLAMADSNFKNELSEKALGESNKPAGMARNVPQGEQNALVDNGVVNDGGIGYASGGGQSDMSNTFPAIESLAFSRNLETSNTPSPSAIPVPNVEVTEPSMDFGDGKDFGKGWGSDHAIKGEVFASDDSQNKGGFTYEPGSGKKESLRSFGSLSYDKKLAEVEKRAEADLAFTDPAPTQNNLAARSEMKMKVDKAWELAAPTEEGQNEDPFANNRPTDDPFAASADPFTSTSHSGLANLTKGGMKKDLSALLEADEADNQKNNSAPTSAVGYMNMMDGESTPQLTTRSGSARRDLSIDREFQYPTEYEAPEIPVSAGDKSAASGPFIELAKKGKDQLLREDIEGFVNYGSPIQGEPKQVDITKGNDQSRFKSWLLSDTDTKAELDFYSPADPAKPIEFESLVTGFTGQVELPLLGDIPMNGRLFQEGEQGNIEHEVTAGYKSEYLFRGKAMTDQKKPSLIDLSEELSAAEEVFSTFSLNISDASFQLALAAIEKGERPDPTSIKPEQFYNAIDYGDPAPSASEPVAAEIDQTAHPVIPGRNLVRVALRTGSTGRSAAQPLRLTLLVDQSGSMVRADRRVAMETALAQLATLLTEQDQVTVIGFSRTPHLLAQSLPGNQAAKLPDLINQTASEGGTNLEQAINLATEQALSNQLAGAQNRIVLFTDGAANLGDADPDRLSEKIKNLRQQGLAFDIAGIGTNDVNDRLLSDLARHGNGRYYLVGEKTAGNLAAQLAGAFRPAAENVKVQVKLNPQRVGNYKLIGFEKDRLKTEDFRNDTVDAAELAADEAGVALYQIETLPDGAGEIGEVSVRFRDTASGEMVERTWTIPYDASAPSFDKANPKTQLATLALLAAQKLQTGPMADAINFSNYSETIAKLKQDNAKSAKTQLLLNLINALK